MRRLIRWSGYGLLTLAVLLGGAAGGGYWWLTRSLPQIEGEIRLEALLAPVAVVRDAYAVPHVEAASFEDALFAQGFVHAQDRLWQMEFQRRVGAGRLAEIVGPQGLPVDRFMRMLGLYRLAEASVARLEPESQAWLQAYADGVNAFLAHRSGPLPPEFLLLGHDQIEPWRPADSIVWIKMMALDLSGDWRGELLRARLAKRLSDRQMADLWPDYPEDAPITLAGLARGLALDELAAALPEAPPPGQGSNAWMAAGSRSVTKAPLLANDPHLGLRAPGTWYLAHLRSPELELIGAGLPGVPGIVLGHNGDIAWGMTNTGPDTQDLFIEKVDPEDQSHYLTPDGAAPFEVRTETIAVKGEEPIAFRVRATRHGPVISDLVEQGRGLIAADQVLALAWIALDPKDTSIESLFRMARARDWGGFVAALEDHGSPQQNLFYADRAGHIGFLAPGRVPIRKAGDGLWPVPGWSGDYDWTGTVPFADLPRTADPASGLLWNANNRIVPEDYPYLITANWEPPYRAERIGALLADGEHSLESFARIQGDEVSLIAEAMLPSMLEARPASETARDVMDALERWDRVTAAERAEPLIFAAWYREMTKLIYADELGDLFPSYWNIRPQFMERVLSERQVWCDDVGTPASETCQDMAAAALAMALADLGRRHGDDWRAWRWGEAHPARMAHPVLDGQPVIQHLANIERPTGGDSATVNVGHYAIWDEDRPFASVQAASYRGLYDLADLDRSRFVAATGQSGHPLSSHYRDLADLWAAGETISMSRDPSAYGAEAIGRLDLIPCCDSE